jgi:hypothetical protein
MLNLKEQTGYNGMNRYTQGELDRFNKAWEFKKGCHIWRNYLDKDGYGTFYFKRKPRRAHRVAYYIFKGDIPKNMYVDHICNNRACVNISHLRVVTPKQNSLENSRSVAAINALKRHCPQGHEYDRKYGGQRYCSKCESAKTKRLRAKWYAQDTVKC